LAQFGGNVSLFFRLAFFSTLAAALSAQTVSVEELRNPLKGKSLHAILTAQRYLKSGQRERGLQELREAMKDPAAIPYAISMLGVEHLKASQLDTALYELEQAVCLLPGRPENRSNLAYVLYLQGQTTRGLEEARKALQLDPSRPKTRLVMGLLLLQRGSHETEAIQYLQAAADEIPGAHLVLAKHYKGSRQDREAEQERRAFTVTDMGLLAVK
jgi:Flp pilus assembly protein TadD